MATARRTARRAPRHRGDALFAGAAARVLYNGIVVAAVIPLRSLFYTGLRDALILDGIFEFDA